MTDLWATGLGTAAHVIGIVGSALIVVSLVYSLRKRKWGVRWWSMRRWLGIHHWAGFIGGVMVLGHTLGNMEGLALALVPLMVIALASSGLYFLDAASGSVTSRRLCLNSRHARAPVLARSTRYLWPMISMAALLSQAMASPPRARTILASERSLFSAW